VLCFEDWTPYETFLAEGRSTSDIQERKVAYAGFQNLVAENVTNLFLYNLTFIDGAKSNIVNFKPNASQATNVWNAWEWDIQE
jgi:ABC-type transport system substrate-binding protein